MNSEKFEIYLLSSHSFAVGRVPEALPRLIKAGRQARSWERGEIGYRIFVRSFLSVAQVVKKGEKMSEIISAVPKEIKDDILWKIKVYRQAIQLYDKSWDDSEMIRKKHYFFLADQFIRSVGSISSNIAEGYSRSSLKDKNRFYEYALGSARESRDWYYKARHVLDRNEVRSRMQDLEIIIKLLHVMIRNNRKRS